MHTRPLIAVQAQMTLWSQVVTQVTKVRKVLIVTCTSDSNMVTGDNSEARGFLYYDPWALSQPQVYTPGIYIDFRSYLSH